MISNYKCLVRECQRLMLLPDTDVDAEGQTEI